MPDAVGCRPPALPTVDELQEFLLGAFPGTRPPYVIEETAPWGARLRLPRHALTERPGGTVSGPSLMGLADCTAWIAVLGRIGLVPLAVTTSLHIDFLRRPAMRDVVADGTLLKLGARLAVVDVAMRSDAEPDPLAKAQVTYSIPPR